jgi:CheY-like chemotaxis protein
MSQVATERDFSETQEVVRIAHRNGDAFHPVSKTDHSIDAAANADPATCEAAARCVQFLARLSHQMRTPLSSLLGTTQMLLDTHLSEAQKEFADTVAESANALTAMAEAIADFSVRLAACDLHLRNPPVEINENGAARSNQRLKGNTLAAVADLSNRGTQDMLPKTRIGDRSGSPVANFRIRVPPDTAKLIRILVAEDHITNQQVLLRMLARLGFSADAVGNGVEAIAAITRSPYDIILMDCQMPELDGYEATRQIRKSGGRFRSTPIIAVTANAMDGDREKCLASGMSDYMSKPVLAQTLASTLEKWILPDGSVGEFYSPGAAPPAPSSSSTASAATLSAPSSSSSSSVASGPISPSQAKPQKLPAPGAVQPAAPSTGDLGDAVDAVALEALRSIDEGDEGFMTRIIDLFLGDLSERLEALQVATAARDGDALKRLAHALKGSCGHFGATQLAALCRRIEQIGLQRPVPDAGPTLRELEAEAARVRVALEKVKTTALADGAAMEEPE